MAYNGSPGRLSPEAAAAVRLASISAARLTPARASRETGLGKAMRKFQRRRRWRAATLASIRLRARKRNAGSAVGAPSPPRSTDNRRRAINSLRSAGWRRRTSCRLRFSSMASRHSCSGRVRSGTTRLHLLAFQQKPIEARECPVLHRVNGAGPAAGQVGDLVDTEVVDEPHRDHLLLLGREPAHRLDQEAAVLGVLRQRGGIGMWATVLDLLGECSRVESLGAADASVVGRRQSAYSI